jgi:hypothetical protein
LLVKNIFLLKSLGTVLVPSHLGILKDFSNFQRHSPPKRELASNVSSHRDLILKVWVPYQADTGAVIAMKTVLFSSIIVIGSSSSLHQPHLPCSIIGVETAFLFHRKGVSRIKARLIVTSQGSLIPGNYTFLLTQFQSPLDHLITS